MEFVTVLEDAALGSRRNFLDVGGITPFVLRAAGIVGNPPLQGDSLQTMSGLVVNFKAFYNRPDSWHQSVVRIDDEEDLAVFQVMPPDCTADRTRAGFPLEQAIHRHWVVPGLADRGIQDG